MHRKDIYNSLNFRTKTRKRTIPVLKEVHAVGDGTLVGGLLVKAPTQHFLALKCSGTALITTKKERYDVLEIPLACFRK